LMVRDVTTPILLPPPPRNIQKTSAFSVDVAVMKLPSAKTTKIELAGRRR
jgi:hypothetical protein